MQWHFINKNNEHYITQGAMTAQCITSDMFQFLGEKPVFITEDKEEIHIYIDDPALSDWIKTVRKYRKWTQQQLSDYSEVSVQYISQIERKFIVANPKTYGPIISTLLDSGSETTISYGMDTIIPNADVTDIEIELLKTELQETLENLCATNNFYVLSTSKQALLDIYRICRALSISEVANPQQIDFLIDTFSRHLQQGLQVIKSNYNKNK